MRCTSDRNGDAGRRCLKFAFAEHRDTQAGGNIIHVSSITARRTIKSQFPYAVSKGAMTRTTEVMALEAAGIGRQVGFVFFVD